MAFLNKLFGKKDKNKKDGEELRENESAENEEKDPDTLADGEDELTEEEILGVRNLMIKVEEGGISAEQLESWAAQAEDGELPEEMLELVSGGLLISSLLIGIAITTAATGVAVGTTVGIGAGVVSAIKNRW